MSTSLLIADAGPLFSLAAAANLSILDPYELRVPDVVYAETAGRAALPGASAESIAIRDYLAARQGFAIVQTTIGALIAAAGGTTFRNAGELAIQSLVINLERSTPPVQAVVLFEDYWFQNHAAHFGRNVFFLSTAALVYAAQEQGDIPDAAPVLQAIRAKRPTFNDQVVSESAPAAADRNRRR